MKKKLVAFAVTAAMLVTSAVPAFAAVPADDGWDNGAKVEGIKVTASEKMLGGAVNNAIKGDAIEGQSYEMLVDLSEDYSKIASGLSTINVSLQLQDEDGTWADQATAITEYANGKFTVSSSTMNPASTDPIVLDYGIYTYKFTVEKVRAGIEYTFEIVETGDSMTRVFKPADEDKDIEVRNLWVFGAGSGPDTYKFDIPFVMYTEQPGYVTDVEIVDEDGEVVTNPVNGQVLQTKVTMSSGLEIIGEDSHFDYKWSGVTKNGKELELKAGSGEANASYTVNTTQLNEIKATEVKVEITAKNGYYRSGEATTGDVAYIETERLAGDNRYETATAVADALTGKDGAFKGTNAVVVASGNSYCDALSGTYLANVKEAPLLLINDNNEDAVYDYIVENLKINNSARVYILGGTSVVSQDFEDSIYRYNPVRLGGADRYETNLAILEEAGVGNADALLVASGTNFADALSAASTGNPVLLVGDKLTKDQREFIKDDGIATYYVVGGTAAVSNTVKNAVNNNNGAAGVTRLGGANRYATNDKVIKEFFDVNALSTLVIASGNDFADALTGGVYAAANETPLALVNENNTKFAKNIAKVAVDKLVVIGGTAAVSDGTIAKIA